MTQLPGFIRTTANEDSSSDDKDQPAPRRICKNLKSCMDRTGATTVINKVTWPYEVVYTSDGKPSSYQDISVPQFVHGYMIVVDSEETDIKVTMAAYTNDLRSDAQLYSWERTRAFHGVWLNQLEQGR